MDAIPTTWMGEWMDESGRTITIDMLNDKEFIVSIRNPDGHPFKLNRFGFQLFRSQTIALKTSFTTDKDGRQLLQVEAGKVGLGPTYKLYFVANGEGETIRPASCDDAIDNVRIMPEIGMGLYDDWEDDLGVPWALPLSAYRKLR